MKNVLLFQVKKQHTIAESCNPEKPEDDAEDEIQRNGTSLQNHSNSSQVFVNFFYREKILNQRHKRMEKLLPGSVVVNNNRG